MAKATGPSGPSTPERGIECLKTTSHFGTLNTCAAASSCSSLTLFASGMLSTPSSPKVAVGASCLFVNIPPLPPP
eukprot:CAMPEP_0172044916 /NCGR_PEP_ID=MMETSP1041-20130122/27057_1 /TAXON_ID=464988 /ORGANISM="Hemiselmis andersenii, Strain CCMP439" /LENGTH=74 /DNA_ID=CAMNT_0012703453 /DNA_START=4 /DNA_END=228 /DNA_ORIENTATION=+